MFSTARRTVATLAALGALALGGSAIAGAAQSGTTASSSATTQGTQSAPQGPPAGPHSANGKTEQGLSGDAAAKVKAAALKKVSGTVERVETNVDSSAPYEAHIRKSDGTEVEVQVDSSFEVTAVNAMQHP